MKLIAIELNDAGIMAAVGSPPQLLELDGQAVESPGFALPHKDGLLVGRSAANQARLFPRQILNSFWDQIDAEIVFRHLDFIWQAIQPHGDEVVLVVPGFYDRKQLGIILGIAQELAIPVKGFVPLALAAASSDDPDKMLLHLDATLHRTEVVYLKPGEHLIQEDSAATTENGLIHMYQTWVDAIAREFVSATRFDPYHRAASEQELYDRLPGILSHLAQNASLAFEMTGGSTTYRIILERDRLIRKAESIFNEICRLVENMRDKHGDRQTAIALQLSHRVAQLPGLKEKLATIKNAQLIELDRGAGACGALNIWNQIADQGPAKGVSFFTRRPWTRRAARHYAQPPQALIEKRPTHVLYRSIAYAITARPLYIGLETDEANAGVKICGRTDCVSRHHCSIQLVDSQVVLNDTSTSGTYVGGSRVEESTVLKLGQIIRLGSPEGEELQLIACLNGDET